MSWEEMIAVAMVVKQRMMELDVENLWPHHLPNVAADEDDLARVEQTIGRPLDPKYKEFLRYADGWSGFYQSVDLFGTRDLIGSPRMDRARTLLASVDKKVIETSGCDTPNLLPIAVSSEDIDLFVLVGNSTVGEVVWFAGGEIDRFPDFVEFFLAMVDYNREDVADLMKEIDGTSS